MDFFYFLDQTDSIHAGSDWWRSGCCPDRLGLCDIHTIWISTKRSATRISEDGNQCAVHEGRHGSGQHGYLHTRKTGTRGVWGMLYIMLCYPNNFKDL